MKKIELLHLSLIPGIGPGAIEKLIQKMGTVFAENNLYNYTVTDFKKLGVTEKTAQKLVTGLDDTNLLDRELALIEKHVISWCTIVDDEYPQELKEIHLPPPVLYVQGNLQNISRSIAFVGARKASHYGKRIVELLVPDLVQQGWCIVSGGAYGIDTFSHQAALDAGGATIAVLGSGLLQPYPSSNKEIFKKIVENGGAVVSSFALTMGPTPGNFPARNRIISGLSRGAVVVQAAKKSGALITARYALDQGKSVFAVPGPIDDKLSMGCHELLQKGARLVASTEDILEEFGVAQNRVAIQTEISQDQDPLVAACFRPQALNQLAQIVNKPENIVQEELFELQLKGKVEQNFAGLWERV